MKTIMVQMADERWTLAAINDACNLARKMGAKIALLHLMRVQHLGYLGTNFGMVAPTTREYRNMHDYAAIAEAYDVEMMVTPMQCVSPLEAVADAADQLDAEVVFAYIPQSHIPYWRKFQIRQLEHSLKAHQRQLFTLDKPVSTAPTGVAAPDHRVATS
jgi:hypothetical protein